MKCSWCLRNYHAICTMAKYVTGGGNVNEARLNQALMKPAGRGSNGEKSTEFVCAFCMLKGLDDMKTEVSGLGKERKSSSSSNNNNNNRPSPSREWVASDGVVGVFGKECEGKNGGGVEEV